MNFVYSLIGSLVLFGIIRCIAYTIWKKPNRSGKQRSWPNANDRSFAYFIHVFSLLFTSGSFLVLTCAACDLLKITNFGYPPAAAFLAAAFTLIGILLFRLSRKFLNKY